MTGRRFQHAAHVHLRDAAPDGRARLDAIARWLQDAAYLDVVDAGFEGRGGWVVRRSHLEVERFPAFGEPLTLETWCSGLGKMWAERRTTVTGERGARVEATALWVFLDAETGRPQPLDPEQIALWGSSAAERRVRARLQHPDPPADAEATPWCFRAADLDVAGHVNNAAYWTVVEEELAGRDGVAVPLAAEVEHRGAAAAGEAEVRRDGDRWWICGPGGDVHASIAITLRR